MIPIPTAIVEHPTDHRPEPPPFPILYPVGYQIWSATCKKWLAVISGSNQLIEGAQQDAQRLINHGHRNVRIFILPGSERVADSSQSAKGLVEAARTYLNRTTAHPDNPARACHHCQEAEAALRHLLTSPTPPTKPPETKPCCSRDYDSDGNCDIHSAPKPTPTTETAEDAAWHIA